MGVQRTSFAKLERERAKKAKQAAKMERRLEQASAPAEAEVPRTSASDGEISPAELMARIEDVHRRYDAEEIDFEEFEAEKAELLSRLTVD